MAQTQLKVSKEFDGDTWIVTAEVLPDGDLPLDIFTYENTGKTELGKFKGVCSVEELTRFQKWTGVAIKKFGNKFVRASYAKIIVSQNSDPDLVIAGLVDSVKFLSRDLKKASGLTQIISI